MIAQQELVKLYAKQLKLPTLIQVQDIIRQAEENGLGYEAFLCEVLLREIRQREVLILNRIIEISTRILLSLVILLTFNNFASAGSIDDQKKVDSIKVSVENLFEREKPVLEADKKNWGLSDAESFSNAILGDGVTYYLISDDFLKGKQADPFIQGGYIFPIKIGEKAAGTIEVQEINA